MMVKNEYRVVVETTCDGESKRRLEHRRIFGRFNFFGLNAGFWWHLTTLGENESAAKHVADHRAMLAREMIAETRITQRFRAEA